MENKFELIIKKEAQNILISLREKQKDDYSNLINSLQELSKFWLNSNNIKNIWDDIFRKRVWRWRILFTIEINNIFVWIIKVEKDTKKDYKKWKDYIKSKM